MTTHTPGPWRVTWSGSEPAGHFLLHQAKDGVDASTRDATARLIAAAPETAAERDTLKAINAELLAALGRIAEGKGAYNRDPLEHASNVIDEGKATALEAIAKAQPAAPK